MFGTPDTYFEGTAVYGSEIGSLKNGAAFTLPGIGIFVNPRDLNNTDLLRHEYGHILQADKYGYATFYLNEIPTSVVSAAAANNGLTNHWDTWTEWNANKMSYDYFGKPTNWDFNEYQISPSNLRMGSTIPFYVNPPDYYNNWLYK